jgi:hypothetical protein
MFVFGYTAALIWAAGREESQTQVVAEACDEKITLNQIEVDEEEVRSLLEANGEDLDATFVKKKVLSFQVQRLAARIRRIAIESAISQYKIAGFSGVGPS